MSVYDPRVDVYIEEKAAPFAKPILIHIRALIHQHCPDITENIKWGFPHFDYKGKSHFSMAAFKQHCAFGFWLGKLMSDPKGILQSDEREAMGSLGRIESIEELPPDKVMTQYLKESIKLADGGMKITKVKKEPAAEVETPDYFLAALKKNKKALSIFEKFAPSHRKEYIEWIVDAKREETRNKRIAQAIMWMEEGKSRNWKYQK